MRRRAAIALIAAALPACAVRRPVGATRVPDIGVNDCAAGASDALLSVDALQCWFLAPHGRWRILSHDSHFDVLVVQAEALDLRDATFIAKAFAANQSSFSEILIYVRTRSPEGSRSPAGSSSRAGSRSGAGSRSTAGVRTRRVRWTKTGPLEIFDFTAPPSSS